MTKLPVVSGKDAVKALLKIGYDVDHQRGSHIVLRQKASPYRRVTIPNHKEIVPLPSSNFFSWILTLAHWSGTTAFLCSLEI